MKKKLKIAFCITGAVVCLLAVSVLVYLMQVFPADETVAQLRLEAEEQGKITIMESGVIAVEPAGWRTSMRNSKLSSSASRTKKYTALIFYPGARVEPAAYIPLMYRLAESGVACYIVSMPNNLAMFDKDAAEDVIFMYELDSCDIYLAGHSMGASAASSYVVDNAEKYKGFIMMGSYSGADLTDSGLSVLTIHGTEDGLMAKKKGKSPLEGLPADTVEVVIQGGCHAYFGNYGPQDMDGTPTITREDQQAQTVAAIKEFMGV